MESLDPRILTRGILPMRNDRSFSTIISPPTPTITAPVWHIFWGWTCRSALCSPHNISYRGLRSGGGGGNDGSHSYCSEWISSAVPAGWPNGARHTNHTHSHVCNHIRRVHACFMVRCDIMYTRQYGNTRHRMTTTAMVSPREAAVSWHTIRYNTIVYYNIL